MLCLLMSACTSLQVDVRPDYCNFNHRSISTNISFKIGDSDFYIPVNCIKV